MHNIKFTILPTFKCSVVFISVYYRAQHLHLPPPELFPFCRTKTVSQFNKISPPHRPQPCAVTFLLSVSVSWANPKYRFPLMSESRAFLRNQSEAEMVLSEDAMTPGPILPRDAQNKWRESTDAQTHSPQLWWLDAETLSVLPGTEVGGGPLSAHCVLPL